nr:reverse transcriptase domain-containing protein [Tanacetum cinerariifolium]
MADNRTMAQMLQAPIEGYEDAIPVPQINENNFELKQTLINLVQSNQFTGRQDPHNHLRFFNKVTSTFRHLEVPNTTIKLLLFPFSLEGEARIWLDKEPPRSILTWENLVSNVINQFFPPSKTTYLRNENTNFLHKPNEMFNEAWERFKDLLSKSKVRYSRSRVTDVRANTNAPLSSSSPLNSFDLQQIAASLEDKLDIRMNRFEKSLNDMKNYFVTPTAPLKVVEESLLREEPCLNPPIIPNQTELPIEEPKHSFNMGCEHFNTNLVTNDVAESSTKNLIPIPNESKVVSKNGSKSTKPVNDNSLVFTTISNPLFDDDKINYDEINSHVESNSDESTSNHDTVKFDYLDEFYGPFIPFHILEEERIRREQVDYINRMEMLFTINPRPHPIDPHQEEIDVVTVMDDVLPPSVENKDSAEEVDVVDDLRVDNSISNPEHAYSESEDSDFNNPPVPLPPPEPPDKEFDFENDFEKEISVVRNTIVKFECIDTKVKFDVFNDENDDLSYFMFVIFAKVFSLLSAESKDTIFDPGISTSLLKFPAIKQFAMKRWDEYGFVIHPGLVMAAPVIPISSDSSKESVGSHVPQVILFGTIPTYSDPPKVSLPIEPELPLVSPFLCTDDSKADSKSEPAEQRPDKYEYLASSSEFPVAPVVAPPRIHFTSDSSSSSSSSDSSSKISLGSSSNSLSDSSLVHSLGCDAVGHQSHPWIHLLSSLDLSSPSVGPSRKRCRSLTTLLPSSTTVSRSIAVALVDLLPRKSEGVGAPTKDGIGMGVEVANSDIKEDEEEFEAEASAGGTMEIAIDTLATGGISEPTGGDAPDLEGTLYDISHYMAKVPLDRITEFERDLKKFNSLVLESCGIWSKRSAAVDALRQCTLINFRAILNRARFASLSTLYPPTTSKSSLDSSSGRSFDSSSPSAGPSRKRCRSPTTLVPSSNLVSRSIAHVLADLSPHKRFIDSHSSEASGEEHMEIGTADVETVVDLGVSDRVRAPTEDGLGMKVEVATSDIREDEEEFEAEASAGGTMEIVVDPLVIGGIFEPTGGDAPDLEGTLYDISHYIERAGLAYRVRSLGRENPRVRALLCIERDRVDSLCRYMALSQEFRQICRDRDDTRMRLRRTMTNTHSKMTPAVIEEMINRRVTKALETREANRNIGLGNDNDEGGNGNGNGNENGGGNGNGNHNENDKDARHVVQDCTYQDFMKCQPLNFKGTKRVVGEELTMLSTKMVPEEDDQVEKFIGCLPDNIQGNVIAAEPTRLQDTVRMSNNLMDQKLKGYAMKNAENKRKFNNSQKDNLYNGPLPLCNNCKFHHERPCTVRCGKCNKKGHYKSDFPKLKDQNHGNKTRNNSGIGEARGKAYVLGGGDANPESNIVTGMFLLKNHYASVIFDSGVDLSFVSTTFGTLLDIIPDTLDVSYAVKLADERTSETNTVLRGCMLGLLGNPFNIDLMPVELGSFDIIIGMDWLANHHAMIVCDEKIMWIPYGDKFLIVQGDRSGKGKKSNLSIISCTKTHKYIKKGFPIFLAQVMEKETEDKSEEKRFEDVPTSEEEHTELLKLILKLLKKEELYAKFSKCEFWLSKVQFLGHMIDSEGIHVDPAKIELIKD